MCHALSMPRSGDTEGHPEQTGGDSLCSQRFIWAWQFHRTKTTFAVPNDGADGKDSLSLGQK